MNNSLKKEKRKTLIIHLLFPLMILIILYVASIVFVIFSPFKEKGLSKLRSREIIIDYVNNNSDTINKFINNEIETINVNDLKQFNNIDKECNDETCFYRFDVASYGLSISGCYVGFYYSINDIMHKYEYSDRIINGDKIDSYKVTNENGGKYLALEKIKDNFYYFEDCY